MDDVFETDEVLAAASPGFQRVLRETTPAKRRLLPEGYQFVVDTREQRPWDLEPAVRKGLPTGDYSITGLEEMFCIERKSLPDLLGVIGSGRARFERELERMGSYHKAFLVIECPWERLVKGDYRSADWSRQIKMNPSSVVGSLFAWMSRFNVMVHCAAHRGAAEDWARGLMVKVATDHAKGRWPWTGESGSGKSMSGR